MIIITQKKILIRTAMGESNIDGKRLTVLGKRRPLCKGKYGVLVDGEIKRQGSFADIFVFLRSNGLGDGLNVLGDVANGLKAPRSSLVGKKGVVSEFEASVIKLLEGKKAITNVRLLEMMEVNKKKLDSALFGLQNRGFLVPTGKKEGGGSVVQTYQLTKTGEVVAKI